MLAAQPVLALCGDGTGDGRILASDALAALRAAVSTQYEPQLDVYPIDEFDGSITAGDALRDHTDGARFLGAPASLVLDKLG